MDGYTFYTTQNVWIEIGSVEITEAGEYTFTATTSTKNGAATGYVNRITYVDFVWSES